MLHVKWAHFRLLLCMVLLLSVSAAPGLTQGPPAVLGGVHTFDAAGQQHAIAWSPAKANPASVAVIQEAVTRSLQVYNRLFGALTSSPVPMRVYVYLSDGPHPNPSGTLPTSTLAAAGRRMERIPINETDYGPLRDICYAIVYNTPFSTNNDVLKFTIAHEIAHCYQAFYVPAANPMPEYAEADWWVEGSAEWLATQVYHAPDEGGMNSYRAFFVENHGADLISGLYRYDGVFYWSYLSAYASPLYAVRRLRAIPASKDALPAFFIEGSGLEFANWGRQLALNRVPYQPVPSALYSLTEIDATNPPARTLISVGKRSFQIVPVRHLDRLPTGLGLEVTIRGPLRANGAHIATLTQDYSYQELAQDELTILFCNRGAGKFLIFGRGNEGSEDMSLTVSAEQKACEGSYEVPEEDVNASDDCYQGDWHLVHWPVPGGEINISSFGISGFSVDAEGAFTLTLDGIAMQVSPSVTMRLYDIVYSGFLKAERISGGQYGVRLVNATLEGRPRATMQVAGGAEQTISTDNFTNLFSQITPGQSGVLTLICRTENTLEYRINASGAVVSYFFSR